MAITKAKKEEILSKLSDLKEQSSSVVFVGFKGLPVAESTDMRTTLRTEGINYFVTKKTLIARVLKEAYEGDMPTLEGEVALAYSTDAIAPAQKIREFEKKYAENIAILGGVFEGVFKTKEEMTEIASIPSLPVLRGMFVNVINAPIQGLVLGLNAIAEKKNA